MWHGEPCPRDRSSGALQVYPVVGVPEPELHAISVIANCVCCRPWTTPKLKPRSGRVACDHGATGSHRVSATTALKTQNWHPVADEHGDHHREPQLALLHFSDQVLVNELLLNCQICVRSEAPEDPVEQDFIPVVDLQVCVAGRGVPEHRPRERLKSLVWQSWRCLPIPSSARGASLTLERERQNHLDPVQRIVGKKSHWKTWTRRHHLVSLREHIDGAGSVCHDLWNKPSLKRRHHPVIAVVNDHDRGVFRELLAFIDRHKEPRHLDLVGIVGAVGRSTVTSAPLIVLWAPSTVRAASATIARHGKRAGRRVDHPGPQFPKEIADQILSQNGTKIWSVPLTQTGLINPTLCDHNKWILKNLFTEPDRVNKNKIRSNATSATNCNIDPLIPHQPTVDKWPCIYIYMYTYMNICIYIYIFIIIYMYVCMYVCMSVCMYVCMYVYIYIYIWGWLKNGYGSFRGDPDVWNEELSASVLIRTLS